MRPQEISYESREKHFIDVSNGEILAGQDAHDAYVEHIGTDEHMRDLGELLHEQRKVIRSFNLAQSQTDSWGKERCVAYGQWLLAILEPAPGSKLQLSERVLANARTLGVGPGLKRIAATFGSTAAFYEEIGADGIYRRGSFDDWTMSDYVAYVRKLGKHKAPIKKDLDRHAERDPKHCPRAVQVTRRFNDIGGFQKIVELAGYPVVSLWDKDDYVAWGVKYMEANEGALPTSRAADFFAAKRLGPSGRVICNKFDTIRSYQFDVARAFWAKQEAARADAAQKMTEIKTDITGGRLPEVLLAQTEEEPVQEAVLFERVAKYRVIGAVAPSMSEKTKLAICLEPQSARGFVSAICKNRSVTAADIEHAALILEVFDDIWPMNDHLEDLKVGTEYDEYCRRRNIGKKGLAGVVAYNKA